MLTATASCASLNAVNPVVYVAAKKKVTNDEAG